MERTFVGAALGFAFAILLAVASVELVGINNALAGSLMDAAIVIAVGVAGILVALWGLDSLAAARRRRVREAALAAPAGEVELVGEAVRNEQERERSPVAADVVPWVVSPGEVVVSAPTATAWDDADLELSGAPRAWYEAVEAADLDGVFLDPRAFDAETDERSMVGRRSRQRARVDVPARRRAPPRAGVVGR